MSLGDDRCLRGTTPRPIGHTHSLYQRGARRGTHRELARRTVGIAPFRSPGVRRVFRGRCRRARVLARIAASEFSYGSRRGPGEYFNGRRPRRAQGEARRVTLLPAVRETDWSRCSEAERDNRTWRRVACTEART